MSYIVMIAQTKSSRVRWSQAYRRVAVVQIDDTYFAVERMKAAILHHRAGPTEPAFIGERAKGTLRVVETWEHLNVGTTSRSAFRKALRAAGTLAMLLNAAEAHEAWMAGGERLTRDF